MLASLSSILFGAAAFAQVLPAVPIVGSVLRPIDTVAGRVLTAPVEETKRRTAAPVTGAAPQPGVVGRVADAALPVVGSIAKTVLIGPVLRAADPIVGGATRGLTDGGITTMVVNVGGLSLLPAPSGGLLPTLPGAGAIARPVDRIVGDATGAAGSTVRQLADARLDRISRLVRANPGRIVLDPQGFPARAGEVVLTDPDAATLATATANGFMVIEREDALGVGYVRLSTPRGVSLTRAVKLLQKLGAKDVSADQLYAASGTAAMGSGPSSGTGVRIGMIDGGVAGTGTTQRGFAVGAPRASAHGTAVASLIAGAGRVRGAAPGARILAADVYGSDPAGGNATAIARALAWLVGERVPVITISLVGPPNPLLGKVVAAAQARGTIIVAAVGNDGPASPHSYPASFPGVIAVTATDAKKRILIEAGRAAHLDYAAPGADMVAADAKGGYMPVRGTSFAAPLVAATLARSYLAPDPGSHRAAIGRVDAGAERLGARYGRGLVCGQCPTPAK